MISEIDLRDWDYDKLRNCVSVISDPKVYNAVEEDDYLREFIQHIEVLSKHGQRQIAALFKSPKGLK